MLPENTSKAAFISSVVCKWKDYLTTMFEDCTPDDAESDEVQVEFLDTLGNLSRIMSRLLQTVFDIADSEWIICIHIYLHIFFYQSSFSWSLHNNYYRESSVRRYFNLHWAQPRSAFNMNKHCVNIIIHHMPDWCHCLFNIHFYMPISYSNTNQHMW